MTKTPLSTNLERVRIMPLMPGSHGEPSDARTRPSERVALAESMRGRP